MGIQSIENITLLGAAALDAKQITMQIENRMACSEWSQVILKR